MEHPDTFKVIDLVQEDGPVLADSIQVEDHKDGRAWFQIFGTVDLEGAVSVRAYTNSPNPDITWQTFPSFEIPIFQAENGKFYFWGGMEAEYPNSVGFPQTLDILDKDGTVLFTYDLYTRYMPKVRHGADTP